MFVVATRGGCWHVASQPASTRSAMGMQGADLSDHRARGDRKSRLHGLLSSAAEGVVERSCQLVDTLHADVTLSKGLGARHWAGAATSRMTKAIAVVVSQSTGTVRLFQHGHVVLRVEPFRRAMKWKDFEYEPAAATSQESKAPG